MDLIILGSNSAGNCYILKGRTQSLLIEAGVHPKEIKKALNFDLAHIVGCIVTHEHGDHFKYVDQVNALGIDVYGSGGTLKDKHGHRLYEIKPNATFSVGQFKILPFKVNHDAREPFGYIIGHPESGNILFLTDSAYTEYRFPGLNQIIVESNHARSIIEEKVLSGKMQHFVYRRLIESHMSIEGCEKLLLANDLSKVTNIVLIHLSDANSHEVNFKDIIERNTGKKITMAAKGTRINFDLIEF